MNINLMNETAINVYQKTFVTQMRFLLSKLEIIVFDIWFSKIRPAFM